MGVVSYGQGGYVGASMSARAKAAYESGEMPMSKWTRGAIISAIKDYCADFDLAYNPDIETMSRAKLAETYLEYKSWHHTGRFARETEFFGSTSPHGRAWRASTPFETALPENPTGTTSILTAWLDYSVSRSWMIFLKPKARRRRCPRTWGL